jgi:hypothetical protein
MRLLNEKDPDHSIDPGHMQSRRVGRVQAPDSEACILIKEGLRPTAAMQSASFFSISSRRVKFANLAGTHPAREISQKRLFWLYYIDFIA